MKYIDLHTHTNISDGFLSPSELIEKASNYDLKAMAICDHDTIDAFNDLTVFEKAQSMSVELITGVEFSVADKVGKYHILGLCIDVNNPELIDFVRKLQNERVEYARNVSELLESDGWKVDLEGFISRRESITKAHVSRSVLSFEENFEKLKSFFGKMPSEGEFTESFLIKGCKYFLENNKVLPSTAIEIIHKAKGIAILAHPAFNIMKGENFEVLCQKFLELGIDGFEAINIQFDKSNNDTRFDMVSEFTNFAKNNNVLITGGSDYHHSEKELMGNFIDLGFRGDAYKVPYGILEELKKYKLNKYGK